MQIPSTEYRELVKNIYIKKKTREMKFICFRVWRKHQLLRMRGLGLHGYGFILFHGVIKEKQIPSFWFHPTTKYI